MRAESTATPPLSQSAATRTVFHKILVSVESPEASERPADVALTLAAANKAELVVLHVIAPTVPVIPPFGGGMPIIAPPSVYNLNGENERRTSKWVTHLSWMAQQRGVRSSTRLESADRPVAEQVIRVAEQERVDLIVVGTHQKSGLDRLIFGSVSSDVIRVAKCPVLVVQP